MLKNCNVFRTRSRAIRPNVTDTKQTEHITHVLAQLYCMHGSEYRRVNRIYKAALLTFKALTTHQRPRQNFAIGSGARTGSESVEAYI